MSGRRLDVTATQAISSMLATLTGAIAASGLGIAGTIIGAAFMSLASTIGAAVYKHYLARSNERLRAAAANLAPRAGGTTVAAAVARRHQAHHPGGSAPALEGEQPAARVHATDAETEVIPALAGLSHGWQQRHGTRPGRPGAGSSGNPGNGNGGPGSTEYLGAGNSGPADDLAATADPASTADLGGKTHLAGTAGPDGETDVISQGQDAAAAGLLGRIGLRRFGRRSSASPGNGTGEQGAAGSAGRSTRRRWLMVAAVALGVFIVAMGAITAFEAVAGKPLETVVWHRPGSGTTVGGLVTGPSASHRRGSRPGGSQSPTGSSSSPTSARPSGSPSPSGPASPTSSPTGSARPSSSASPSASSSSGASTSPSPSATPSAAH